MEAVNNTSPLKKAQTQRRNNAETQQRKVFIMSQLKFFSLAS
jgi:hypothetical protein